MISIRYSHQDGEYIIFISDRRFTPTYCDIEWEMIYQKVAGIYAVTLKKDGKSILPYKSDEENLPVAAAKNVAPVTVRIDFEGITDRIEALPLKKGNYRDLSVNKSTLFYLNADEGNFNRFEIDAHGPMSLYSYSFDSKKETSLAEEIDSYKLVSRWRKHNLSQRTKRINNAVRRGRRQTCKSL